MCNQSFKISTDDSQAGSLDVTTAAVAATYETGLGQSALNTFLTVLSIPPLSNATFADRSSKMNDIFPLLAENSMKEAAALESALAVLEGRVSEDGVPWIYVTADGAWCKRSYGTNYNSSGGIVSRRKSFIIIPKFT